MTSELKSPPLSFKKLMGFGSFILRRGFSSSKCKTEAKLATARIKLLRNKREVQVRQMRRDLTVLLRAGLDDTARIRLIEKLSVRKPAGEVKMKVMKEIAKQYQVDLDAIESEKVLLKPPEELLDGPRSFVSASSIPVKPTLPPDDVQAKFTNFREESPMLFKDMASAAQAAADSAERAVSAAQAAAYLANQNSNQKNNSAGYRRESLNSTQSATNNLSVDQLNRPEKIQFAEFQQVKLCE